MHIADHTRVELILRGTHTGVMQSTAGARPVGGRAVALRICEVYQVKDRKITRHATYYDALGFMQQLGVLPTTA